MVKLQKENKMVNYVSPWILILVIPSILIKDMLPSFDRAAIAQTAEIFQRDEFQPIFTKKHD